MALTVRDRIAAHFETGFKNVQAGTGGYTNTWDIVTRQPINPRELNSAMSAIGIYDVKETKARQIGYELAKLSMTFEFFWKSMMGDNQPSVGNTLLGEIQKLVLGDCQQGGLALDTVATGTELDLESFSGSVGAGIVTFLVTYRHKLNDPFSLTGE